MQPQILLAAESPSEDDIQEWLANADIEQLEKLVLDGRGHMLLDKQSDNDTVQDFLKALSQYQVRYRIHFLPNNLEDSFLTQLNRRTSFMRHESSR